MTASTTLQREPENGCERTDGIALLQHLWARRSTPPRHLSQPGPTLDDLRKLVRAAARAPDHKGLAPFRFIAIEPNQREALADVFARAEQELDPSLSDAELERARERAHHAPALLAVVVRREEHSDVPAIEQYASAGAALGYILLGAGLLGFGSMAVSGHKVATNEMRRAFGLGSNEEILCFVGIGTPTKSRGTPPDLGAARLQIWQPAG